MAYTQDDLNRLEAAISTGAKEVRFSDNRQVVNRSQAEMLALRAQIKAELANNGQPAPRTSVMAYERQ